MYHIIVFICPLGLPMLIDSYNKLKRPTSVVQKHTSPLAVFQMNCLRCICGICLQDYVPDVDVLTR